MGLVVVLGYVHRLHGIHAHQLCIELLQLGHLELRIGIHHAEQEYHLDIDRRYP